MSAGLQQHAGQPPNGCLHFSCSALRFTKRDLDLPKVQPYQMPILRMMATLPNDCELKIIIQGSQSYFFATPDGLRMSHQWDGREWKPNADYQTKV